MIVTRSTRAKDYDNDRTELFCPEYFLYVNSFGDVYPCCHQIKSMKIGNIGEPNIYEKIIGYEPENECRCSYVGFKKKEGTKAAFLNVNVEFAGECNGSCVYCFQKDLPTFKKSIAIYDDLEKLLRLLKPRNMMVFGGEIGIQDKTIRLLEAIKKDCHTIINIATNGNIKTNLYAAFDNLFESIQVTFNGFQSHTVKALSDLDFHKQKRFCERAIQKHSVSVKFMITPISIMELSLFLSWALEHPFQHVIIDAAFEPSNNYSTDNDWGVSMMSAMTGFYWDDIIQRIAKSAKLILQEKALFIVKNDIIIMFSNEVEKRFGIDAKFYEENNLAGQLTPKNVCISHKAWRSLLK